MTPAGQRILAHLEAVERERVARLADPGLGARVTALKAYQQQRFARTYSDLLTTPRYAGASRFFLEELYGPRDYTDRDAQFARIVPALVRLFPDEIIATVETLAALHALSESIDSEMARRLGADTVDRMRYVRAWQATGREADRERQIALTLQVGQALERYTRKPLLRQSLRMMRGPARAAGMSALQHFLETGFDTFGEMRGAAEFLNTIGHRERVLAAALFAADEAACHAEDSPLGQLP